MTNSNEVRLPAKPVDCYVCMELKLSHNQYAGFALDDHLKEEACQKYHNAKNLLPDALVKELQSYIQGGYLYVPADQAQQKRWGEASGYRQELQQRNRRIVEEFRNGSLWRNCRKNTSCPYTPFRKIIYQK